MKSSEQDSLFENILKSKTEGFELTPSEAAWQKVEAALLRKKRRRKFLFWLLPVCIIPGLTVAGYFLLLPANKITVMKYNDTNAVLSKGPNEVSQPIEANYAGTAIAASSNNKKQAKDERIVTPKKHNLLKNNAAFSGSGNSLKKEKAITLQKYNRTPVKAPSTVNEPESNATNTPAKTDDAALKSEGLAIQPSFPERVMPEIVPVYPDTVAPLAKTFGTATEPTKPAVWSHWSVGLNGSVNYAYRRLSPVNDAGRLIKQKRDSAEIAMSSFHAGIHLMYTAGRHWSFISGISYAVKGEQTRKRIISVPDYITTSAYKTPSYRATDSSVSFKFLYRYVELPVLVQYNFSRQRLSLIVGAGFAPGLLSRQKLVSYLYHNNTTIKNSDFASQNLHDPIPQTGGGPFGVNDVGYRPYVTFGSKETLWLFNIDAFAQAGVRYDFTDIFFIEVSPVFCYGLLPPVSGGSVKDHLYSAGLNGGIFFRFK